MLYWQKNKTRMIKKIKEATLYKMIYVVFLSISYLIPGQSSWKISEEKLQFVEHLKPKRRGEGGDKVRMGYVNIRSQ